MRLPVVLLPRRSRQAAAVLVTVHAAAMLAAIAALPIWASVVACAAIAVSALYALRRPLPREILLKADGRCLLTDLAGNRRELAVLPATMVHRLLVTLVGRDEQGTLSLMLPVDAVGPEGHRRLRVWLRWRALSDPV